MNQRVLGGLSLLALGLNGVVGVGIFFLPATLAGKAPGLAGVALLVATALALAPVALTFAALGRRFDEDGGPVVYARAAFGDRAAFVVGWVAYLSAVTSTAAVLAGLCRYSLGAWLGLSGLAERGAAVAIGAALLGLTAAGLGLSARVWTFLTIIKLLPLLGLIALWLLRGGAAALPEPAAPASAAGWAGAALAATFAYQGFEIVPLVAGHARASERSVPRAMMGSLLIAALLYALLHRACLGAVGSLASSKAPLVDAARALAGDRGAAVLGAGANLSSLGIAFGMAAMTPRYLAALGPELGASLAQESPRGVPLRAVAVTAALVGALLLLGDLSELFALSSVAVLAQYGVTSLALLRLARDRQRGFSPRDAWPAPLALLATAALVSGASLREAAVAAAALVLGLLARWRARPA